MNKYSYVFVRKDISVPDQMVQVGHVCMEAGKKFRQPKGTHLILLEVEDSVGLGIVVMLCGMMRIRYFLFYEPDEDMKYTALCTEPVSKSQKDVFKSFKLWRNNG